VPAAWGGARQSDREPVSTRRHARDGAGAPGAVGRGANDIVDERVPRPVAQDSLDRTLEGSGGDRPAGRRRETVSGADAERVDAPAGGHCGRCRGELGHELGRTGAAAARVGHEARADRLLKLRVVEPCRIARPGILFE
jgi:hypothetical protein